MRTDNLLINEQVCTFTDLTFVKEALTFSSGEYEKFTSENISSTLALLRMDGREVLGEHSP